MSEEATNTDVAGQEAASAANADPASPQVTPEAKAAEVKATETPSNDQLYTINYKGQEEKLPLNKLIDFAQQGRDYSEKMGQINSQIETRAQELADAAFEKWAQDQATAAHPAADPNAPAGSEELDEFTKLQQDVAALKREREEKEGKQKLEAEVVKIQKSFTEQIEAAVKKYPMAAERNLWLILRSNPEANIEDLARYEHDLEKKRQEKWEADYLERTKQRGGRGAEGAGGAAPAITPKKLVLGENTQEAVMEMLSRQN